MAAITLSADYPDDPFNRRTEPPGLAAIRRQYESIIRRQQEALLSLDNLLAPQDWLDAGDGFPGPGGWRINRPAQRTQDRSNAPLSYLNEDEWRQHIALARDLCTRNHLALGFRDHVSNFIGPVAISFVRRGQKPGAGASGGTNDDSLATACQQVWDEWCEFAEWGQGEEDREEECRRRLIVEGEATLRFFVGDEGSDGLPHVRHVEPELIRTPSGHSTVDRFGWGVITAEGDDEREQGLWLCDPVNVALGRVVDMRDYVRMKFNVDRTVKRGLSDFFPVAEHLKKILGLFNNMAHVARLQAAIAWWEQFPTATDEQVRRIIQDTADYNRPKGNGVGSTDVTGYEAGTVVRTEGGRQVLPGPVSDGTAGFDSVQRIVLRAVGFRWGCPSYFSGDGDASFASVLVTGSPFVRITESKQERVKAFACRVATRVLEFAERSGRLPVGTSKQVRPVGTCRPVVIADEEKKARTFLSLYAAKCASPMEYIRSTGADPAQVAAEIKEWEAKFPPQQPPGGLMPPDAPPADPDPTPPGSAGGDGSSPNPTDALEAKREGEVWQGGSGRWFTLRDGHVQPAAAPANADSTTARAPAAGVLAKHPLADKQYLTHLAEAAPTQDARDYLETAAWNVPGERTQLGPAERRHQTVERLAAAHRDAVADGKPEAAEHVAQVLRWFGGTFEGPEPGAAVPFDGAIHDADAGRATVWTGDASTVVRQPVRGPSGRLAIKGEVKPGRASESALTEHIGNTETGETWFSDDLYSRLSESGRAGLTLTTVTDKNRRQVKRWVRQTTDQGAEKVRTPGGVHGPEHVVSRALASPGQLTAIDVAALADHAAGLDKESLRQLNLAFQQRIGGTKAELANRLVAFMRTYQPAAPATPPAVGATAAVPASAPPVGPRNVQVTADDRASANAQRLFGENAKPEWLQAASNAGDGAKIEVTGNAGDGVDVHTVGDGYRASRSFDRVGGKIVVYNNCFSVERVPNPNHNPADPNSRPWINRNPNVNGTELLTNQVRALRALGVSRIETCAARSDDDNPNAAMNGYYTWPRLGYDASIPTGKYGSLPDELKAQVEANPTGSTKPRSILDLMSSPAGRKWWKKNGGWLECRFDLSDNSLSMRTLESYLKSRRNEE